MDRHVSHISQSNQLKFQGMFNSLMILILQESRRFARQLLLIITKFRLKIIVLLVLFIID
jgi:hypothetical protein